MTEATNVWMSFDPATTIGLDSKQEYYTYYANVPAQQNEYAAQVFHKVFPLSLTQGPNVRAPTSPSPAMMVTTAISTSHADASTASREASSNQGDKLSGGMIAGISIGSVVAMALTIGTAVLLRRKHQVRAVVDQARREENNKDHRTLQPQPSTGQPDLNGVRAGTTA